MKQQNYLSDIVHTTADNFRVGGLIQLHVNEECVGTIYVKASASPHMTPDEAVLEAQNYVNLCIENASYKEVVDRLLNFIAYFETIGRDELIEDGVSDEETRAVNQRIVSLISIISGNRFWQSVVNIELDNEMSCQILMVEEITMDGFIEIVEVINSESAVMH